MKVSKAIFAVIAGTAISGAAFGQEAVQAEKQAPIKKVLPDAYGSVEVRHSTVRSMDGDKVVNDVPTMSVRPTLGTTLFDGAVDTAFTFRYNKKAETTRIYKTASYNETSWTLIGNDTAKFQLYALTYLAGADSYSTSDLGFNADAAKSFDIVGGALKLSAYINPTATMNSGKNAAGAENKVTAADRTSGLALTETETSVEKESPGIWNTTGIAAKYSIAAVSGLAVGTGVDFGQNWEEKLAIEEVDSDLREVNDGYKYRSSTLSKVNVSYKLNDKTTLIGQVRGLTSGFYAQGINTDRKDEVLGYDANRFEARVSLNATLF